MTEREVVGELARALGQGTDLAMVANHGPRPGADHARAAQRATGALPTEDAT